MTNVPSEITSPDDLVDYLRRAAVAVYVVMDRAAADDLSPQLTTAANEIEWLRATLSVLRETVDSLLALGPKP